MKPSRMEMLFWGHSSAKDPDIISLYFRVTINSQRAELGSTGIKVHRKQWSQEGQRLTARTPEAGQHNQTLSIWKTRVQAIYNDLLRSGEPFTASYVKKLFHQEGKGYSFIHLFDHYLASLVKNPDITEGTRETYATVRTKVGHWLASTKQGDLLAERFGKAVLEQYRTFMRNDESRKPATIRKHSNTIKQVLSYGYLNDYIQRNPLQGYRVPSVKPNKPVYLTKEELVTLINYDFGPDKVLGEVRDYFLIQCFTGLAYSDIKGLRYDHFSYQEHEEIGMIWLEKDRVKPETPPDSRFTPSFSSSYPAATMANRKTFTFAQTRKLTCT
ncbi:integrase [Fibrella aestuarina BUZ 2]|uniref:Integrase n=1 Tax=Fibrella aestuarina BUZ 2 TaxID=1166018 RepID=I0KC96_9BACT|nr:phage integrase SAM-like domain-containing protein [Fibrella aestuarina]CCH01749.1 integrase [Fibrella aestuarina BUZ 2]